MKHDKYLNLLIKDAILPSAHSTDRNLGGHIILKIEIFQSLLSSLSAEQMCDFMFQNRILPDKHSYEDCSNWVIASRKYFGHTQKSFAKKLDVSLSRLAELESKSKTASFSSDWLEGLNLKILNLFDEFDA